jgi:RNA polymerase sigma-70 factor (ECF subfamily)
VPGSQGEGRGRDDGRIRALFEEVALPYMGLLFNTAVRLAGSRDAAGDIVQETYLRAFRTFGSFEKGTNAKAWLFTILYSVFTNRHRKVRREPEMAPLDGVEETALADGFGDELAMLRGSLPWVSGPEAEEALSRLPESLRETVLLVDLDDLTYEEAATVLSCPVGTVRSRLYRARKLLYDDLRAYAVKMGYLKGAQ